MGMRGPELQMTLTEQATLALKQAILKGDLRPGRIYTAGELGKRMNVSRTPIREALQELSRRGLVVIEKNRGMRVLSTSVESLLEVFQIRLMLEVPLARRATQLQTPRTLQRVTISFEEFRQAAHNGDANQVLEADRDFHHIFLTASKNERALQLLREQRDFVLSTGMGTVPNSRTPMECFEDHSDIMEAFRAGDADAVASNLSRHIIHTATMLIEQETSRRPEFADVDAQSALSWLVH